MNEVNAQLYVGIIAASVTFIVAVITLLYNLLHERAENKRFQRQLEIEERRAKLDKSKLAIELYNQREIRLFEARLENYPTLYERLMPLASRDIDQITPEQVLEIEGQLKIIAYTSVSSCISANTLEALTELRNTLAQYAHGEIQLNEIKGKRISLFQAMHRDLARSDHHYLGPYKPQFAKDHDIHEALQEENVGGLTPIGADLAIFR